MLQQVRFQQDSCTLRIPSCFQSAAPYGSRRVCAIPRAPAGSYFSASATLSMPALAQASSLSPPGAPETPTAPIVSLPTLIGSAPCAGTMLSRYRAPAVGLVLMVAANSPDGRLMVRAV